MLHLAFLFPQTNVAVTFARNGQTSSSAIGIFHSFSFCSLVSFSSASAYPRVLDAFIGTIIQNNAVAK